MDIEAKALSELRNFRSKMGLGVSREQAKYIWGKNFVKNESVSFDDEITNVEIKRKVEIAKNEIKYLKALGLLKFVGVSGSVGAGFAKEDDDIDVFVVVKNYTSWIYRGIITLKNLFHHRIRMIRNGGMVKDKFCVNLIREERDLIFDDDIFNFHELMYLIPIYNERYLNFIYSQNGWLREGYGVKGELLMSREFVAKRRDWFLRVVNFKFFVLQILFMIISLHRPEIGRLWSNYKRGRIEFFPGGFRKEKIQEYNER
mgnify:CR=1 FL=1